MTLPPVWNRKIWEGDDYSFPLYLRDKNTGNLLDVSAGTWTAAWRQTSTSVSETTIPMDVTDAANGLVIMQIDAALTRTIAAISRVGVYDIQWNNTVSTRTYLRGKLLILQDVER